MTESAGHTHSDACYQETQTLVCTDDSAEHTHSDTCYEKTKTLICTTAESSGHTHSSGCYAQNKVLTCGQEESAGTEERTLTCTKTEVEVHTHSSGCYTNGVLTCGKMEIHQHTHTDTCFETVDDAAAESDAEKEPICGKEEHEHDENCYSDATADIETAEDWERTFENIELTGVYADDLLEIAKSQLGYAESTKNYIINEEDSRKKGYSRYGDWYGDKYGDWCAMYVSFCLSYSEVVGVPYESNCQDWIDILSDEKYDLYAEASEYTPKVGDIIFFDWQGDGVSDHVGIVAEVTEATETEPAKVKTIEGNSSDRVEYNCIYRFYSV